MPPRSALLLAAAAGSAALGAGRTTIVPFAFNRGELAIPVAIAGRPLLAILDTGVDPSAVDLPTARALHLPVDEKVAGEASGEGEGQATVYPATVTGLTIGGRRVAAFAAAASDLGGMSAGYGKPLHLVLGYSFLRRQRVLVDYPAHRLVLADDPAALMRHIAGCRQRYAVPLRLLPGLHWPVIPGFRLAGGVAPVSLDTGSNAGVSLYQAALALPGVTPALREAGSVGHAGFRGDGTVRAVTFGAPIGFGPFRLPPGQAMTVRHDAGSATTRVANVGNQVFAAMRLKMLLDYPGRRIVFWGACG